MSDLSTSMTTIGDGATAAPPRATTGSVPARPVPTPVQQDPGVYQDPGLPPPTQHHVAARPMFYVPAPHPPPFLHYQWPMPFSYNPYAGFPGMGYGIVMPQFPPPPPYMEAPAYILPHPHIQPVDYRRLHQPQVPSGHFQNPNQTRRVRLPPTVPVRETVNCEVQTEPMQTGVGIYAEASVFIGADSGNGTASTSPSSLSTGSHKQENYTIASSNTKDFQDNGTSASSVVEQHFNVPHPTGAKNVQACIGETLETQMIGKKSVDQGNAPPRTIDRCNVWSVDSPDSMVPVCSSSQQEDEAAKERRISVPDILMSWGSGTPQAIGLNIANKMPPHNDQHLPSYETEEEQEKSFYPSPTATKTSPVVTDGNDYSEGHLSSKNSETLSKILKLPFSLHELLSESRKEALEAVCSVRQCSPNREETLPSLKGSHTLPDNEQGTETNPYDSTDTAPYETPLNNCQMKRKMNESVWSVESIAAFFPNKEWLQQNDMFDPKIIIEMTEEAEDVTPPNQNDNPISKCSEERRQSRRLSSSDSVPMSDSWIAFSTPAEKTCAAKKQEMEIEGDASESRGLRSGQSKAPSEKDPSGSPTCLPSEVVLLSPNEKDTDGSSEPEVNQSPNQECPIETEQQEKWPHTPEPDEPLPFNFAPEGKEMSTLSQLVPHNGVDVVMEEEPRGDGQVSQPRAQHLCVPLAEQKMAQVSPSKAHLVDCGVQCTELQGPKCSSCEEMQGTMGPHRRHPYKHPDMKKANNGSADGLCMNGHVQKTLRRHWKNKGGQEKQQSGQQEFYSGYYGKPGKSKGGNGRNPRY